MAMASLTNSKPKSRSKRKPTKAEEAMRRRGFEAFGFLLVLVGIAALALLLTYDIGDPSFFNATDSAPTNLLGVTGSYIADMLYRAVGWASYGVPVSLLVWGGRMMLHVGHERAILRMIFVIPAIALASVFIGTHVPPDSWVYGEEIGLGGTFGDIFLGFLLSILPGSLGFNLMVLTLVLGALTVVFGAFALGVTWVEYWAMGRGLWNGFVTTYAGLKWLVTRGISLLFTILGFVGLKGFKAAQLAKEAAKKRAEDIAARRAAGEVVVDDEDTIPETGLSNRLSAKIADAVRSRKEPSVKADTLPDYGKPMVERAEPAITGPSRPRAEPPLTSPTPSAPEPLVQHPQPKKTAKSVRARQEEQPSLALEPGRQGYETPPMSFLANPTQIVRHTLSDEALNENARMLENVLDDYGVKGEIVAVRPGPVVTMYELEPSAGLKASRVIGLADDIARSMSALAARVSTIPGRSVIGIELPNENREMVLFREIVSSSAYGDTKMQLPLALGKDIGGEPVVANLARMPHLLIAGTTGSGKSVGINTMILSLLYTLSPEECRMIMIDPKMLELSVYDGIPHLLSPVVTDPKKAVVALKWTVAEMEERYRKMSKMGVRNIDGYNGRVAEALAKGEGFTRTVQTGFDDATGEPVFETEEFMPEKMPYIVVIVDEMADLMMVAGKEIEACIQRLAQMARASGIHLIMATQRPSVDVITGTVKANFPTRISFQVTSKIDSRTILGEMGAEQLLGMGDMLYMEGGGKLTRVHGPFVSDEEVEEIVKFLKAQGEPEYVNGVQDGPEDTGAETSVDELLGLGGNTDGDGALYDQAVQIVARDRKCSTSYIQRKLSIGYNKAAKLVEEMEENGVVSAANHVGKREILVPEIH